MNHKAVTIFLVAAMAGVACFAQTDQPTVVEDFKPST